MKKIEEQKLLLIGVEPNSLINFRDELIKSFEKAGKIVTTVSLPLSVDQEKYFLQKRIKHVSIFFQRNGLSPIADLRLFFSMSRLYSQQSPELVLAYTIKPVIYGGLVSRVLGIPTISTITGLGTVFIRETWVTRLVRALYRLSQKKAHHVFFQNADDRALFLRNKLVRLS